MANELMINVTPQETRVALMENGVVVEFYIERKSERGVVGNIYKGRVIKVLPGMQAAFVDIGLHKAAFLYVTDVFDNSERFKMMVEGDGNESSDVDFRSMREDIAGLDWSLPIQDKLREGQEILVQVSKAPLGTKGARATSYISLPGGHLVLMPTVDHVGISRRIENEKERKRLRSIIQEIKPEGYGFIVRTASEGRRKDKLQADMKFLVQLWDKIQEKKGRGSVPSLIHQDLDITLRAVRDLFAKDVDRLVVDSKEEYDRILNFIETFYPRLKSSVELYEKEGLLFDSFGIEIELARAVGRKVWLKSGGHIVIDITEALVAIDVNTGRYVGKRNLDDTALKINLEAVKEIAYQLRLRNIGGIIIIDFIDMTKASAREKVFSAIKAALKKDRCKTNILRISELGLVQMTRQRTRENIVRTLSEPCPYCEGKGFLKSRTTICYEVFRGIRRECEENFNENEKVLVNVHPDIASLLFDEERLGVEDLENKYKKKIIVNSNPGFHEEQYEIAAVAG